MTLDMLYIQVKTLERVVKLVQEKEKFKTERGVPAAESEMQAAC
jgi:hypothetical protein